MVDPNQVLVSNLVEALQQLQRFIVIGLGASVSALALTGARAARGRVTVLGTSVAVVPDVARLILLAVCVQVGALASYAVESANLIAGQLRSAPALLAAACTFPSVATSPYVGVRILAALLPFVFAMAAVVRSVRLHRAAGRRAILGWLVLLGSAYGALVLALIKSTCLAN
jgi:hypothetical protein